MGKVYVGQSKLKINVNLEQDVTGATVQIYYIKPSNVTDFFTATIDDAVNGLVSYDVADEATFDEVGTWTFYSKITFSDLKVSYGEPFNLLISPLGT